MSRRLELLAGLMLLGIGMVVLAADWLATAFVRTGIDDQVLAYWPLLVIVTSFFFLVPALVGRQRRPLRAGMAIPGTVLAVVGGVLLYTSLNDRWLSWSYLWTSLPFSIGIGMYLAGWIADAPAFKWVGSGVAAGAVVAYLVFANIFGDQFRVIGALGIIALIGTDGGTGHVIEYAGDAVRALSMAGRMTLCNMVIEAGGKNGVCDVDEKTLNYVRNRSNLPDWEVFADGEPLPLPASYLLDARGFVAFRHVGRNAADRASDLELLAALRELGRQPR
jgi:hypothetical protein